MDLATKDLLYISGIALSAVVTFLTTKHKLKEFVLEKHDNMKDKVHALELEVERLKGRDDLQQQVIGQLQSQVLDKLPELINSALEKKNLRDTK
ncbi:MAG: hypothetical protein WAU08_15195 [Flavobacteriales bacterium]|jgi:hypothetical protein